MESDRKKKYTAVILTSIGAIIGILGTWILFINYYEPLHKAMALPPAQGGVATDAIAIIFLPIVCDLAIVGGVLYLISALAFYSESQFAFPIAVIGNILSLQASFWPFIPAITVGEPPVFLPIFFMNLTIYFILLIYIGKIGWLRTILALATGITFVMSFMNGVASTKHIIDVVEGRMDTGGPIYVISQRINWIGAFGFAGVTSGIILWNKKEWVRYLGVGSAILVLLGGLPLAIINTIEKGGDISMFFFAPVLTIPLLLIFVSPLLWKRIVESPNK